jgi:NAD(P)-dependent dehydrogenase (short-subunit alcohol dehydrogenase family)
MRLRDKVAVITGAGQGLGRQSALLFAEEGARLVLGDLDAERNEETAELVRAAGGSAVAVRCDVSREPDVADLVARAEREFGRLDVMYNNAGIAVRGNGTIPFEELTDEDWQRQVGVNLSGVFYGCKHAIAPLRRNGGGSIVNTSSAGALASVPGWAIYSAVKGGVNVLTKGLAVDVGKYNIRVNAMCPVGGMSANFTLPQDAPLVDEQERARQWDADAWGFTLKSDRPPQLIDHAQLALYLASDDSAYMTGQCLVIDGGLLAQMPRMRP